jgi:hypothetical protein
MTKIQWVALIAVLIIAIAGCFLPVLPNGKSVFGTVSTTCQGTTTCVGDLYVTTTVAGATGSLRTDGSLTVSSTGTTINGIIATTCTGIVYASLAATTSQAIDCAVTGALTSAKSVTLGAPANLQSGNYGGLVIWGGHASTTAGYVEGYITNLTGQATTSYALATTSIPVLVIQ